LGERARIGLKIRWLRILCETKIAHGAENKGAILALLRVLAIMSEDWDEIGSCEGEGVEITRGVLGRAVCSSFAAREHNTL